VTRRFERVLLHILSIGDADLAIDDFAMHCSQASGVRAMATFVPIRAIFVGSIGGTYLEKFDPRYLVIDDRGYVIGIRNHMWPLESPPAQLASKKTRHSHRDLLPPRVQAAH
jgi:hypothetical protein